MNVEFSYLMETESVEVSQRVPGKLDCQDNPNNVKHFNITFWQSGTACSGSNLDLSPLGWLALLREIRSA
jgi:hypothetical protein